MNLRKHARSIGHFILRQFAVEQSVGGALPTGIEGGPAVSASSLMEVEPVVAGPAVEADVSPPVSAPQSGVDTTPTPMDVAQEEGHTCSRAFCSQPGSRSTRC